ncbi:MAG: tetratricopeptide repeat protein [Sulfuriflexus sp.]|nr:tetratricopeptide repeat protein [Sulfuriflexus sp.]
MADHLTEEQQVEAIKRWWKENGVAVIAGLVLGSLALFGWRGWGEYKDTQAAEAFVLYSDFQKSLAANDVDSMTTLKSQLFTDYTATPYAPLVALAAAKKAVENNDMKSAKDSLQWVLDNTRQNQIQHTARVRLISLMVNDAEYDAALTLLTVKNTGGYTAVYEELRGDVLLAKGDVTAAHAAYDKALQSDGLSPEGRDSVNVKYADTQSAVIEKSETAK